MPRTAEEVWALADLEDVERECAAQIEQALAWGVDVTHLDSHMDILLLDRHYFRIYMRLAERFRLPVRTHSAGFGSPFSFMNRTKLSRHHILTPDRLEAAPWGEPSRPALMKTIKSGRKGVTEFALHPVAAGEELLGYDTENAEERIADAECVMDKSLQTFIASCGIKFIGFRPLRDVMRRSS
jgi:hypothetical protein